MSDIDIHRPTPDQTAESPQEGQKEAPAQSRLEAYRSKFTSPPTVDVQTELKAIGVEIPNISRRDETARDPEALAARRYAVDAPDPAKAYMDLSQQQQGYESRRAAIRKQQRLFEAVYPEALAGTTDPTMLEDLKDERRHFSEVDQNLGDIILVIERTKAQVEKRLDFENQMNMTRLRSKIGIESDEQPPGVR